MRIVFAPDKFKGSLTACKAAEAMKEGFATFFPEAEMEMIPVADGGEGMMDAFYAVFAGEWKTERVSDALGREVEAKWLLTMIQGEKVAVVETSEANGFFRIQESDRNLMRSSTCGVGQLLLAAARAGVERIIAGIGGSATNDAGVGMAAALGYRFLDEKGEEIEAIPSQFLKIQKMISPEPGLIPAVVVASDVANPLLGERGATRVYGPQKGLKPEEREPMEKAHAHLVKVASSTFGNDFSTRPGAGAAGGLGFGLMTFCQAKLQPGFDLIAEATKLEEKIASADCVVTGEGSLDSQTLEGKTAQGISRLARRHGKPVFAIAGRISDEELLHEWFDGITSIVPGPMTLAEAQKDAYELTKRAAARLARIWKTRIS